MDERTAARVIRHLRRLLLTQVQQSIIQSMKMNSDVEVLRQTVCLRCPLSQIRIRDPCRFLGCDHFQCFDATSFLLSGWMTQTSPRCPVCDRDISREALVIDLYFEDILKRAPATVDEVYLQTDGKWTIEDRASNRGSKNGAIHLGPEVTHLGSGTSLDETLVGVSLENEREGTEIGARCSPSGVEGAGFGHEPNAPPRSANPREGPTSPTLPLGAFPASELSRRATRIAATQLPPIHQPRSSTTGGPLPLPLTHEPGFSSPANRDGGQLDMQYDVAPPAQSNLGLDSPKFIGKTFLFLKHIGPGWLLWSLTAIVDLIEGIITIQLSMLFAEYRDFNQFDLGNRVRLVCFTSWWTMTSLVVVIPIEIAWTRSEPGREALGAVIAVFVLTWIFWTSAAGSLTSLIWARKGPDCIITNFPYCKYTQGVIGLAWFIWIMVTIQGVYHICLALRRNQRAQPPGDLELECRENPN